MTENQDSNRFPCQTYRSRKKEGLFLITKEDFKLSELPAEIKEACGVLEESIRFEIYPERPMARAEATEVIEKIKAYGFYLQLPPEDNKWLEKAELQIVQTNQVTAQQQLDTK